MTSFNPQIAPVDSIAGEDAVDPSRLNISWIRSRFNAPPIWQPESTDEQRLFLLKNIGFKSAAVLIGLVQREHGLNILFTRRTAHLSQHAGQISFPGGGAELQDRDVVETALRESQEEVGLDPSRVEVLGRLPDYYTLTGYCVAPVVAAIADLGELISDQNEVAEIFEVPLAFLMDGRHHQRRSLVMNTPEHQGLHRIFYAMPYQDYFIWGVTAGMLRNLFHFLRA